MSKRNRGMDAIQFEVWYWINVSFEPKNRPQAFALKAPEEVAELVRDRDPIEAADVAIALMAYCSHLGLSLADLIEQKMAINWDRTRRGEWVQDENGVASRPGTAATRQDAARAADGGES